MHPSTASARGRAASARLLWVLGALALALALMPALAAAQQGDDRVTPARVDGQTRFHTAANVATTTFTDATVAVLATGQDYPDALAASYAAGIAGGPVLLTARDALPGVTRSALDALDVQSVVLIGGARAISPEVEADLIDDGYEVVRHRGANRFETAAAVATAYGDGGTVGALDGHRTALLASGENFPDALSAGPLAAAANLPLLLTPTDGPHGAVTAALEELDIERIVVVGGQAAVSSAVVQHYDDLGYEMERFAGRNRMETAVTVARNAIQRFGFTPESILLARGDDYPDALTASVHGAAIGGPVLLSATPQVLSPATEGYLVELCPAVQRIRAIGGVSAVSDTVLGEAVQAAERCGDTGLGSWTELEQTNAPADRIHHSAVWDGTELLVWGGGETPTNTGAAYDAATDTWRPLPAAPVEPRWGHEAVWAGDRMLVYGGSEGPDHLADCYANGAAFHKDANHPANDQWTALPPNPHHDAGCGTSVVWTGAEMIVWGGTPGGTGAPQPVNAGAAYNPATDQWRPIAPNPIGARAGHEAVWTGQRMIVFGGSDADHDPRIEAAAYDPATDQWTRLSDAPLTPRFNPASVWTGAELVVVGGTIDGEPASDGAAYDPVAGQWRAVPDVPGSHTEPVADMGDGIVLLVGGDRDGRQPAAVAWDPTASEWEPLAHLPGAFRVNHTVTWAGDRLIVVGGQDAGGTAGSYAWHDD